MFPNSQKPAGDTGAVRLARTSNRASPGDRLSRCVVGGRERAPLRDVTRRAPRRCRRGVEPVRHARGGRQAAAGGRAAFLLDGRALPQPLSLPPPRHPAAPAPHARSSLGLLRRAVSVRPPAAEAAAGHGQPPRWVPGDQGGEVERDKVARSLAPHRGSCPRARRPSPAAGPNRNPAPALVRLCASPPQDARR